MLIPQRNRRHAVHAVSNTGRKRGMVAAPFFLMLVLFLLLEAAGWMRGGPVAAAPAVQPARAGQTSTESVLTLAAQRDTWVDEANPSSNYGSQAVFYVTRDGAGVEGHALIYFDTSALPHNANVISATLELYSVINFWEPAITADIAPIQADAVLSAWTENNASWNNRPPSVYLDDPPLLYEQGWLTFDVTNIAQAWAAGSVANHGIKLRPGVGDPTWAFFMDRSHSTSGPRLTIQYEDAAPPCTPLNSVTIDGPTMGQTGSDYTFGATVSPAGATGPLTYSWSATGQAGSSEATVTHNWATAGQKTVALTVENCAGSASDSHTVNIQAPTSGCDIPLSDLTLLGPTSGATGRTYTFAAIAGSSNADPPVTFSWQATEQDEGQTSGSQLSSDVAWSWTNAGSKQIAVTAENCGASFTRNLTIDIVSPSVLPDLTVGAPWYDALQGAVGYILHNEGQNTAPSGHSVGLYNYNLNLDSVTITETIPGGGLRAGHFGDVWDCPWDEALLGIVADSNDVLEEGDETNNEFSAIWPCDLRAPQIVSGPTVVDITATTARIEWTADELTVGRLEYGPTSYAPASRDSGAEGSAHSVTLSGLQPASTYRARAFVQDEAGNGSNSDWVFFETNTPGVDPPAILALDTTYLADHDYDTYILTAELDDVSYVDRVEFYLDGAHVGSDYSPAGRLFGVYMSPPQVGFSVQGFFDNTHTFEARSYTTSGLSTVESVSWQPAARPAPIFLRFWDPAAGEKFEVNGERAPSGTTVEAHVMAVETDWKCSWGGSVPNSSGLEPVSCAAVNPRAVQELRLRLNGVTQGTANPAPNLNHRFDVNISNRPLGQHNLQISATGSDGELTQLEQPFELVRGEPDFRYSRTVTRHDNVFEIRFSVTNEGSAAARVERIRDTLYGFQIIHRDHLPGQPEAPGMAAPGTPDTVPAWYTVRTTRTGHDSTVLELDLSSMAGSYVRLPPGESFTVFYYAVPILHETAHDVYRIGAKANDTFHFISYREDFDASGLLTDEFFAVGSAVDDAELGGLVTLQQSVVAAVAEADYIIVTNPYGLAVNASDTSWANVDPAEERERLYSDMAELARLADGVIGYYADLYSFDLQDLLEPGGYWYESLHPNFRQTLQGYVLLVGEQEVLPAAGAGYDVHWSDLRYASTHGDARPELVLGRLIGDNVATLRRPLDAAIRYHRGLSVYDHSHALLYAGRGTGESAFWGAIQSVDSRLPDDTDVTAIRSEAINTSQEVAAFLDNTVNRDIIVFRGHGYESGDGFAISDQTGIGTGDMNGLGGFGNSRPFIFALACSAGDYEEDDDYGIAEASLREGAAVFIGATTLSHRYRNNEAARWFFNRFNAQRSIGDAFAELLRDKFHEWSAGDDVTNDTEWGRWAYQYQLYGDPKYGRLTPAASGEQAAMTSELPGGDTLDLTLGELDVVDDGGWHLVSIPDGAHLQGTGQYVVPMQQVIAHYPPGVRVQDVQLAVRSGLVVTSGLNIPISYFRQDTQGVLEQVYGGPHSSMEAPNTGWHPVVEQPFSWRVAENGDGSSDLLLVIYPFAYDPATTDARYYRHWVFDVETISSTVSAGPLRMAASRYGLGDTVSASMVIENSGSAQDVVVSALVRDLQGVEVAGLPLRTLHGVQGKATFDLLWDSGGLPAGEYVLEVVLSNGDGQELDKQRASLTLGYLLAEGVRLEAGTYPGGGDGVALALSVRNSGDRPIDGTVHLRVEDVHSGEAVATFSQDAVDFQPGSTLQMRVVWNDAGVPWGDYRVVGYLRYNGTISTPLIERLGETLYLPFTAHGG